jgi:hypothetical protein
MYLQNITEIVFNIQYVQGLCQSRLITAGTLQQGALERANLNHWALFLCTGAHALGFLG